MSLSVRERARAIATGRGRDARLVVPFAFEVAARISARPLDDFFTDPTHLANGLSELHQAIGADGILCADARGMELASAGAAGLDIDHITGNGRVGASLEACRRLRITLGNSGILLAAVSGPATLEKQFAVSGDDAAEAFAELVRRFCEAGADGIIAAESELPGDSECWEDGLLTARNIAVFYKVMMYLWDREGPLPNPVRTQLDAPQTDGGGLVMTYEAVPPDYDIEKLRQWVIGSS